jgi:hypothetical protein
MDRITLNFSNRITTAAVFLAIKEAFDTIWHPGLLYKLSKLEFSTRLIKLINFFLSLRRFRVELEGKVSTPKDMVAGVPQASVLSPHAIQLVYK